MQKREAATLLAKLDLGSGVAETDTLLESARVETSVFDDLLADRVNLIPGTKGSGKTALYRIFVDFLPHRLLKDRRVVIAYGVQHRQDSVFLAFRTPFDALSEADFIDFWIIYVVSLAHEKFIKSDAYSHLLKGSQEEVGAFCNAYQNARIPEFEKQLTLKEIIGWVLAALKRLKPKVSVTLLDIGQIELTLDDKPSTPAIGRTESAIMTSHAERLKEIPRQTS
jgi:hypothetical protein